MPDIRKTLAELYDEWKDCRKCDLGVRRQDLGGEFVFGDGLRRGVMFVGGGPSADDERFGVPFDKRTMAGELLRTIIQKLEVPNPYLTDVVACRACEPVLDDTGNPRFRQRGRGPALPMLRDCPPLPPQMNACRDRLMEEIYLVDPVVIVSLGGTAAEALTQGHVTITRDRGQTRHIEIPGGASTASLTEKRRVWGRKINGVFSYPVTPNAVRYLLIPTFDPSYALKQIADKGPMSPLQLIIRDIRLAASIYDHYLQEVYGAPPSTGARASFESIWKAYQEEVDSHGDR